MFTNYITFKVLIVCFLAYFHVSHCTGGKRILESYFDAREHEYEQKYGRFSEKERLEMLEAAREMFYHGYDNYIKYAFPRDELDPIHCVGRGPDYDNPSNININDVLGDYSLTLIDVLDTLIVMGNTTEFHKAIKLILENVSFNKPNTVQVFEATIRVIGALLSAHLLIVDPIEPFGVIVPPGYNNEILHLAHDLAARLLPAFENTATGIPFPRVNLQNGVPASCTNETCLAGAGSLIIEFGLLSHLLDDPVYKSLADRSLHQLWLHRSNITGLLGNVINIQTGSWVNQMSGVGAGQDSFFEYLLKGFILFGDESYLEKFNEAYDAIKFYLRKGRSECLQGNGFTPIYVNVNMKSGEMVNNWIDALQAAWPGIQVLKGDVQEAICSHALYFSIWQRYGILPERYNWHLKAPEVLFYPLRPEIVESTYLLYQATKHPYYLHVGREILNNLNNHTRVKCGYATIHNVQEKTHEDRMESFFLSETTKYLYLLFDVDNPVNKLSRHFIFSTEGHLIPLKHAYQKKFPSHYSNGLSLSRRKSLMKLKAKRKAALTKRKNSKPESESESESKEEERVMVYNDSFLNSSYFNCDHNEDISQFALPLPHRYLEQIDAMVGHTLPSNT